MRSNVKIEEGFKKRRYPERKKRSPIFYQHVLDPVGRVWCIYVLLMAEELMAYTEGHMFDRQFKRAGLTRDLLHARVLERVPAYEDYYLMKTGNPLTPNITYDRWHKKSAYANGEKGKGGIPSQSHEHYSRSEKLRPLVPAVEEAFRSGRTLTLEEMRKLGTF